MHDILEKRYRDMQVRARICALGRWCSYGWIGPLLGTAIPPCKSNHQPTPHIHPDQTGHRVHGTGGEALRAAVPLGEAHGQGGRQGGGGHGGWGLDVVNVYTCGCVDVWASEDRSHSLDGGRSVSPT